VTAFRALPPFASDVWYSPLFRLLSGLLFILVMDLLWAVRESYPIFSLGKYRLHRYPAEITVNAAKEDSRCFSSMYFSSNGFWCGPQILLKDSDIAQFCGYLPLLRRRVTYQSVPESDPSILIDRLILWICSFERACWALPTAFHSCSDAEGGAGLPGDFPENS